MQTYTGRLCSRCNLGFYPWFGGCEPCPDKKFGLTVNNAFTVIYRYGIIWLLWVIVNRFLCEKLLMADSLLNFAQMYEPHGFCVCTSHGFCVCMSHGFCSAGVLGGFDLDWPDGLSTFLRLCGILDFDIDVTGDTFRSASAFNQNIGGWNFTRVTSQVLSAFFRGRGRTI